MLMNSDILKFGNKITINMKLPTKDRNIVIDFFKNINDIVEATWDNYVLVSDSTYLIKFHSLVMPGMILSLSLVKIVASSSSYLIWSHNIGIDTITPEMEIKFNSENEKISCQSGSWKLIGNSRVLRDSSFVQSFDIVRHDPPDSDASASPHSSCPLFSILTRIPRLIPIVSSLP
jgi:hypothetical protein